MKMSNNKVGSNEQLKGLYFLAIVYLVAGFAFISTIHFYFDYLFYVVPLHLLLLLVYLTGIFFLTGLLSRLNPLEGLQRCEYLFSLPFALGFILLCLFYAVNILSNAAWGNNVTYQLIKASVPNGPDLLQTASLFSINTLGVLLSLIISLIFFLFFIYAKHIRNSALFFFKPGGGFYLLRSPRRTGGTILLILLFGGLVSWAVLKGNELGTLRGEPILSLFHTSHSWKFLQELTPHQKEVLVRDREARQMYPLQVDFDRKNVIIIVSDSLRADHLSPYGYSRGSTPFLTKLFEEGKLKKVDLAFSQTADSIGGFMAILSSKNWNNIAYDNFKIHDVLKDHGYRINFIVGGDNSNWYSLRMLYGDEIDFFFDGTKTDKYGPNDDDLVLEGLQKVASYQNEPNFFFFLLMSSHFSGVKKQEFSHYSPANVSGSWKEFITGKFDEQKQTLINRYDNGILQADSYIERIFDLLQEKGYLQNSIVWILGDHGDGFGEHGYYGHTSHLYQESIHIPMFIYDDPRIEYQGLEFATQIDVAPSILERLQLKIPDVWQGKSLLSGTSNELSIHQTHRADKLWHGLVYHYKNQVYKYLRKLKSNKEIVKTELYELNSDPGEKYNLMEKNPDDLLPFFDKEMNASFGADS
jgi:glucan phosphoethanolaminetransferase (alkaline phosphatase superfamily)